MSHWFYNIIGFGGRARPAPIPEFGVGRVHMPVWAFIYAVCLSFVMIASLYYGIRDREPVWRIAVGLFDGLASLWLFAGYWVQDLVRPLGGAALFLFLFSLLWTIGYTRYRLADTDQPDFSPAENQIHRAVVVTLVAVLSFPAYWFGGIAALRSL